MQRAPLKVVLVTGGFDPLHSGHIEYFKAAKRLGDILVVGMNSDEWLARKKGRPFMPIDERVSVVENLSMVDHCLLYDDGDGSSIEAIKNVRQLYPESHIVFANGGDRTIDNIPEMSFVDDNLSFVFAVGGESKKNSSSWILQEFKAAKTVREWGYYRVLHEVGKNVKLKELTVEPGKHLSMQRHSKREEFWFVAEGVASLYSIENTTTDEFHVGDYLPHSFLRIGLNEWHQLRNEGTEPLKIIEIQYGEECVEEDIVRKNNG